MRKIVIQKPGGYDRLKLVEFPDPEAGPGEVVIRSHAFGVNYADCCVRWGVYESAKKYVGWPITPGFEFSGKVVDVGEGVENLKPGNSVFGVSFFNAYSTHVKVPEHQVFLLPQLFSYEEAAGFPAVHLTAYHALYQNLRLRSNMKILVHSAAGGVGTALLQLGKIAGCKMIGVVGASHKVDVAKKFGADLVIDKSQMDLWKAAEAYSQEGYDVILDANGPETLWQSYQHIGPSGKLVVYGFHTMLPKQGGKLNYLKALKGLLQIPRFNPMRMCNENKSVIAFNLSFLFNQVELLQGAMVDLIRWIDAEKIRPPKVTPFPMSQVAEAHRTIESGQSVGKLVIVPED
jgi:NADPH:quinone reductase-like Zn-dependent oxidoreductase